MNKKDTNTVERFNTFIREVKKDSGSVTKQVGITLSSNLWKLLESLHLDLKIDINGLMSMVIVNSLRIDSPLDFMLKIFNLVQAGARSYDFPQKKETPFDDLLTTNKGGTDGEEEE